MNIKIMLEDGAKIPVRSTSGAAAWDLFAYVSDPFMFYPGDRITVNTGVRVQLPKGHYWKIENKSGLSGKHGIMLGGGVIDEDYTGIVKVIMFHNGDRPHLFMPGDKIAQVILQKYEVQEFVLVDSLDDTERGEGGFGSTGR